MISSEACPKWQYKISKSRYLVIRLTELETLYLRMWVFISDTIIVEWGFIKALRTTSSRFLRWDFLKSTFLLSDWKKIKVIRK